MHEVVWFDPALLGLHAAETDGVENEDVLKGTAAQGVEGLRLYQQWRDVRTARIARGITPSFRIRTAETLGRAAEAGVGVETVTLPVAPGRPGGRKFGRLVHDMLQHAGVADELESLAGIWGRRHAANEFERTAAVEVVRAALAHPALTIPAGARRYRELPVIVRLDDGTLVDGRIDFAWSDGASWTVIDYKTDRRERRNVAQVQIYALALQRATGLPVRGIVLEV
jgi:ATP-dependent exoDNAse (exonuclease V) beta subunit